MSILFQKLILFFFRVNLSTKIIYNITCNAYGFNDSTGN